MPDRPGVDAAGVQEPVLRSSSSRRCLYFGRNIFHDMHATYPHITWTSSSPVSDIVPVVHVDMFTDTSRVVPLSPAVFNGVCICCRPGDCGDTGAWRDCRVFRYVNYYAPVLATQPPGVTGIYG